MPGYDNRLFKQGRGESGLFDPAKSVVIEAMAVHHITNEMVKDRSAFKQSNLWYKLRALVDNRQRNCRPQRSIRCRH
jgi:DNA polymerase III epsilon subunit-like protein